MTVVNLPDENSLNNFALSLHFDSWEKISEIYSDFEDHDDILIYDSEKSWENYLAASRKDLDKISNLIAQSCEIAMKAKLCSVSPYLLLADKNLIKSNAKLIDFSDLRTIDSVDLPLAIATFCEDSLPDKFIEMFSIIRKSRNKSIHLGYSSDINSLDFLIESLVLQFENFWPERSWAREWINSSSNARLSFFHNPLYFTAQNSVFYCMPIVNKKLTKGQFKRIWKHEKGERRYLCSLCYEKARTKRSDLDLRNIGTSFLNSLGDVLKCEMCDSLIPVIRKSCNINECIGNVITGHSEYFEEGWCHTCAEYQEDCDSK